MIAAAFQARENAYSPYSKFRVGAALLSDDGQIITGANIENASYGGTICAERTAFVKAVSEGIRGFIGLAVTTDVPAAISPCGICRQFIREFCLLDMPILMIPSSYAGEGGPSGALEITGTVEAEIKTMTLGDLLPMSFGPEQLELPRQ